MALSGPLSRRAALALITASAALAAAPGRAAALTETEAEGFVRQVVDEVVSLVESGKPAPEQQSGFRALFARRAAVPSVVRFIMGATWRDMSGAQQAAMEDAFLDYVARVYSELLSSYSGQRIEIGQVQDFGRKGILVTSTARGEGVEDVAVEWLVSDRGGSGPQLVDVVIEGLSMLQSQRQEFAAMLDKRGGDVDQLIADLRAG
ncbi:MlaC/ttg2D family ABC transporter substrate-binding protein [Rhodovulum sp. DZ06]|uniref:MlaC/ttg2D family ABC transporter substrate-binding protein n=1 Tax=Rhodovulum sp. DZ06 TaxID=3425126 RepID=UPI003D34ACDE